MGEGPEGGTARGDLPAIDPANLPAWIPRGLAGALIPGRRSVTTVERLCRAGALTFRKGRPVMIETASLFAYIERTTIRATAPGQASGMGIPDRAAADRAAAMTASRADGAKGHAAFRLGMALAQRVGATAQARAAASVEVIRAGRAMRSAAEPVRSPTLPGRRALGQ